MRGALNQALAMGSKLLAMGARSPVVLRLGRASAHDLGPTLQYRGHPYFIHRDGHGEYVTISTSSTDLHSRLLEPHLGSPIISGSTVLVPLVGPHAHVEVTAARCVLASGSVVTATSTTGGALAFDLDEQVEDDGQLTLVVSFLWWGHPVEATVFRPERSRPRPGRELRARLARSAVRALGYARYEEAVDAARQRRGRVSPYRSYANALDSARAVPGCILVHGESGRLTGALLALAAAWRSVQPTASVHAVVRQPDRWHATLARYGVDAELVSARSQRYYDLLRSAEWVLADGALPRHLVPVQGQRILHVGGGWQPVKPALDDLPAFADRQRSILISDVRPRGSAVEIADEAVALMLDPADFAVLPDPREDLVRLGRSRRAALRAALGVAPEETLELAMGAPNVARLAVRRSASAGHPEPGGPDAQIDPPPGVDQWELAGAADLITVDRPLNRMAAARMGLPVQAATPAQGAGPSQAPIGNGATASPELPQSLALIRAVLATSPGAPVAPVADTRPRVALVPGVLRTNGITSSFMGLLASLDSDHRYQVLVSLWRLSPEARPHLERLLASGVPVLIQPEGTVLADRDRRCWRRLWWRLPLGRRDWQRFDEIVDREVRRTLGRLRFDQAVAYSGYNNLPGWVAARASSATHVFVHSDMGQEVSVKNNVHEQVLRRDYARARSIVVVSEPLKGTTAAFLGEPALVAKLRVVHNGLDVEGVRRAAEEPLAVDDVLRERLEDPNVTTFITIGRLSPEKGQTRLIEAFTTVASERRGAPMDLILVGGQGSARREVLAAAATSPFADRIHLFENINPHPLLRRSDLFVLSSYYEGLPMTMLEALALGVPVLSTAIPGPQEFLESGYGRTCPNTTEGLAQGLRDFLDGRMPATERTLDDHLARARDEFLAVLSEVEEPGSAGP